MNELKSIEISVVETNYFENKIFKGESLFYSRLELQAIIDLIQF